MKTININIVFLAFAALSSQVQAQEFHTVFKEDFDDNRNEWPFIGELDNSSSVISGGFLQYHNKTEDRLHRTYAWAPINPYRDFRIKVGVKRIAGPMNNRVGIRWGSINSYHEFAIAFNGHYTINTQEEGKENQQVVGWTKTTAVDSTKVNELELVKIDQEYFFSINGQLVHRSELPGHFGDNIHLLINAGATAAYDYVYIDEIGGTFQTIAAYQKELESKLGKNLAVAAPGASDPKATQQNAGNDNSAIYEILHNDRKHTRYLKKLRSQFWGKSYLHLISKWKNPVARNMGNSFLYYNYERIKGRQVYIEFYLVLTHERDGGSIENINYTLVRP